MKYAEEAREQTVNIILDREEHKAMFDAIEQAAKKGENGITVPGELAADVMVALDERGFNVWVVTTAQGEKNTEVGWMRKTL